MLYIIPFAIVAISLISGRSQRTPTLGALYIGAFVQLVQLACILIPKIIAFASVLRIFPDLPLN